MCNDGANCQACLLIRVEEPCCSGFMYFSANNQVIVLQLESLEDLEKVSSEQQRDALHVELGEVSVDG